MKSLNYTIPNELNEFDQITNSKHEPTRSSLIILRSRVQPLYQNYVNRFSTIHNHPANSFNAAQSLNLKNCYDKPTAALDGLKSRLISDQSVTFQSLCPYCLIANHSTFDHYIPIESQPVFGVLAKNLVPCCDVCNKKKLGYWKQGNQRAIIHYYNDTIPNRRFLHCDLTFNGAIPVLSYRIAFTNVSTIVQTRIKRHFTRLDLLGRYNREVSKLLSDVTIDVESVKSIGQPSKLDIARFLIAKAGKLRTNCGTNYWRAIAYEKLGRSQNYINTL